jgi:hypothetical protein
MVKSKAYQNIQNYLETMSKENNGGNAMYSDPITILSGPHPQLERIGMLESERKDIDYAYHNKDGGASFIFYKSETNKKPEFRMGKKVFPLPDDVAKKLVYYIENKLMFITLSKL